MPPVLDQHATPMLVAYSSSAMGDRRAAAPGSEISRR
jgi:hypothetical protein